MAQRFKLPDGTEGKSIHCRAAVAYAPNEPLRVEEIEVLPPRAHEVRIKMVATAVCHTDLYTLSGQDSEGKFPVVLGHEGAGIVESVGEGVTEVKRGDMVIPLYIPQCRECKFCLSPKTNLCQKIRSTQGAGVMPDGTTRFRAKDGRELFHFMGCSTFSEYAVVADISVAKVAKEAAEKLETLALLGCGVSTGYGAALNTAKVEKGSTVAVWGLGCVGLGVALGAHEAGAAKVVGVDTNPNKFELARALGCTEFVNPNALPAGADGKTPSLQQHLTSAVTDGGFDYTFECVGNVNCMRVALESCHKGWGISTIIGVAGAGQEISTRPFQLVTGRQWRGTAFGGWKSRDSMPMLIDRSLHEKIPLEKFVTARLPFEDINKAFDLMHDPAGTSIRTLLTF